MGNLEGGPREGPHIQLPVLLTTEELNRVIQLSGHITVIYFYVGDWPRTNELCGFDVCSAFEGYSSRDPGTQFLEADLPRLMASPGFLEFCRKFGIPADKPSIVRFEDGKARSIILEHQFSQVLSP